ncbi:MAG: Hpt domain-containing protein [Idiomarina sp.]|nr:Hpt domain-containing protein [Idiomarina sp.]
MPLQRLLSEFDYDTDFVADLLFTIGNESKQHLERMQSSLQQEKPIAPNELQRIAHLMKSTANTVGLYELSSNADAIEQHIAKLAPSSDEQRDEVNKLISIATEIHDVAQKLLREIDT